MANILHKDAIGTEVHIPHFVSYSDGAARVAANPALSEVGKLALQIDNGTLYRLISVSPSVWQPIAQEPIGKTIPAHIGSGVVNATPTIQAAIDAMAAIGYGEVWLPPTPFGYRLDSPLTLKKYVTLRGSERGMARGRKVFDSASNAGSMLLINHTGNAIVMETGSCADGLGLYWPNQVSSGTPIENQWAFYAPANAHGVTIRNIHAINPYRFAYLNVDGALIQNCMAWPLETGIYLARCADVVRVENVHFNPNLLPNAAQSLRDWVAANGIAFKVTGAELPMFSNVHAFGYLRGLWYFYDSLIPGSTGLFSNIGFDQCGTCIEIGNVGTSHDGLKFSNVLLVPTATGVKITDTTQGTSDADKPRLMFSNLSVFNGSGYQRAVWAAAGSHARVSVCNGEFRDFTNEGALNQSATTKGRLTNVEMPTGSTRINNSGGGDWVDRDPM